MLHIYSEIGKLKKVLLHEPGDELNNLTPNSLEELLFDDIPWLPLAKKEHQAGICSRKKRTRCIPGCRKSSWNSDSQRKGAADHSQCRRVHQRTCRCNHDRRRLYLPSGIPVYTDVILFFYGWRIGRNDTRKLLYGCR